MTVFEVSGLTHFPIYFYGERQWEGPDFQIKCSGKTKTVKWLIFLDSRGVSGDYSSSIVGQLKTWLDQINDSYLIINRPVELTTWSTLINFLYLNDINFEKIITNMGFVDFTPKKRSICKATIKQVEFKIGAGVASEVFLDETVSTADGEVPLDIRGYIHVYEDHVQKLVSSQATFILNTPHILPSIQIDRVRPECFFEAVKDGNAFNIGLSDATVIEFDLFGIEETYDAVHYTPLGNKLVFEKLKEMLLHSSFKEKL